MISKCVVCGYTPRGNHSRCNRCGTTPGNELTRETVIGHLKELHEAQTIKTIRQLMRVFYKVNAMESYQLPNYPGMIILAAYEDAAIAVALVAERHKIDVWAELPWSDSMRSS